MKLSLHHLELRQGSFVLQVDLDVAGQTIGIFGSSGAGKTTLLEIIAGLRKPATGSIRIDNQVLVDVERGVSIAPEHRGVGYVPQDLALFPHLSVRKNVTYARPTITSAEINVDHVAEVLEIGPLLDQPIGALSGGQKQRVAFARALLSSPRLLLMDEPLASLDHDLKLRIIPYLQRIRDEFRIPMLYVSHAPDEVAALCDQIIVLREGKCLRASPPAEIFETTTSMTLKPGIYDSSK